MGWSCCFASARDREERRESNRVLRQNWFKFASSRQPSGGGLHPVALAISESLSNFVCAGCTASSCFPQPSPTTLYTLDILRKYPPRSRRMHPLLAQNARSGSSTFFERSGGAKSLQVVSYPGRNHAHNELSAAPLRPRVRGPIACRQGCPYVVSPGKLRHFEGNNTGCSFRSTVPCRVRCGRCFLGCRGV